MELAHSAASPQLAYALPISGHVIDCLQEYREKFITAEPYKHIAIDDFFTEEFAERLLRDFPVFNPALAVNEFNEVGGKAVNTRIREISPTYEQLYALICSPDFLEFVSELTGIPSLLPDPKLYGGGTHENRHGQSLDAHVDFNYDEAQKLHRRLNLIVYLNKDWKAEWGGSLEVHSNPRRPKENRIKSYLCSFNRAVVFETNEYSWHGFPEVDLPLSERLRSRKSLSIYLYTRERPAHEIVPMHGTFYVQPPLPARFTAGYTLTEADVKHLELEIDRRDRWIETYQKTELSRNGEIADKGRYIAQLLRLMRAPITGYALQIGESSGLYGAGWATGRVQLHIAPQRPVKRLTLRGSRPEYAPPESTITVSIDGRVVETAQAGHGEFEVPIEFHQALTADYSLEIDCEPEFQAPDDQRLLAYVLLELRHEEPVKPLIFAPVTGYATQTSEAVGFYEEGWVSGRIQVGIAPKQPVSQLVVRGLRPGDSPAEATVTVSVNGQALATAHVGHGEFEVPVKFAQPQCAEYSLEIDCEPEFQAPDDQRPLAYVLLELRHEEPVKPVFFAPVTGYAVQTSEAVGFYEEGWVSGCIQVGIAPKRPVSQLIVRGWRPDNSPAEATVSVSVNGQALATAQAGHGEFEVPVKFAQPQSAEYTLEVNCEPEFEVPGDQRRLAYVLVELRHEQVTGQPEKVTEPAPPASA